MKRYPSIPNSTGQKFREIPHAHVFDKLDGSSMRSEWTRERGWDKHGRRNGLLDSSNLALLHVPALFETWLQEPLTRLAIDNRWRHLVVFYEFWGPKSLAGVHVADDDFHVTLFDVAVDRRGIMGPREFFETFYRREGLLEGHDVPKYFGVHNWTRGFVENIRAGTGELFQPLPPYVTFEGVVAKAGEGHKLVRAKAKTQAWIDAVKAQHGAKAESIINS